MPSPGDGSFIETASKDKKLKRLSQDKRDQFARWWEWSLMGMSVAKIVERETSRGNGKVTPKIVKEGMEEYAIWCGESFARSERLRMHLDFARGSKAVLAQRMSAILNANKANDGKGLRFVETRTEKNHAGRTIRKTEIEKFTSVERDLLPVMRELREFDKYEAALDGLMSQSEAGDRPDIIQMDLAGFFDRAYTDPDEAPAIPAPDFAKKPDDTEEKKKPQFDKFLIETNLPKSENGMNGHNGTNGTNGTNGHNGKG